jgi:hypothetical protein
MIVIEWGAFAQECTNEKELAEVIEKEKINLQEARIRFRAQVPGIAFEALTQDIRGSGGKIL